MTEAGSATWPAGAASTQRDRGNLQSFLGFDPTGPRRVGAAWLGSGQAIYSLVDSFSRTGPRRGGSAWLGAGQALRSRLDSLTRQEPRGAGPPRLNQALPVRRYA